MQFWQLWETVARRFQSDSCFVGSSQTVGELTTVGDSLAALVSHSYNQLPVGCGSWWLLTVGDARTVYAGSVRDLLLAYLIPGGDVDWRSSLFASGCTARLGAGNGQGILTHLRTFYLTDDDFYLVSETGFLSPE